MIWESCYWKDPLLKTATWLQRLRVHSGTRESTLVKAEKEIMIGFYSVRNLLDTFTISDATKDVTFPISWFPNRKPVGYLNWHHIDKLFDLENERSENRKIRFLCDRFVHSYVFTFDFAEDGRFNGVYVATDRDRIERLYYVPIEVIKKIFRMVANDYPASMEYKMDPESGRESIKAW